jgi:RNA polymerase sigma factor (sigma-70 family)
MSMRLSRTTVRDLHDLLEHGLPGTWTDGQLIAQFLSDGEGREAAFRALVVRHGPMVFGVCRRVLDDPNSAEDAFQDTFLVLMRKASSLRDTDLLTNWLYGVAHRISRKAKARSARRKAVESSVTGDDRKGCELDRAELRAVIDEEIGRLPERFRLPLILSHLEGLGHREVARRLGCPVGTVESRLSRARERLRSRLARRGLAPSAGALAVVLMPSDASAAASHLVEPAVRTAMSSAPREMGILAATVLGGGKTYLGITTFGSAAAGLAAIAMVSMGLAVVGMTVHRDEVEQLPREPVARALPSQPEPVAKESVTSPERPSTPTEAPAGPKRSPAAVAMPLEGIVIDGDLGDWPEDLIRYPIRNRLQTHPDWDPGSPKERRDFDADFRVGYSPATGLIYLAVVVNDPDLVAGNGQVKTTDAVEIYVDGQFSDRTIPLDWMTLSAAAMPVIQYVGVPSRLPAYGDHDGANPALMYGAIARTGTRMAFRRSGNVTTYEWAVQAFDRYPARPTQLRPGLRLGLDVAVVDRDRDRAKASFFTWGDPPRVFKGVDAAHLGELLLDRAR